MVIVAVGTAELARQTDAEEDFLDRGIVDPLDRGAQTGRIGRGVVVGVESKIGHSGLGANAAVSESHANALVAIVAGNEVEFRGRGGTQYAERT